MVEKKKKRGLRNPNGYGGISYLGENRRNPYRVRITTGWDYDEETGKHKQVFATLGYYPSRKAAMLALADYNKDPYDLDRNAITFDEIYNRWSAAEFPGMAKSSVSVYRSAYKLLEPLHNQKMINLKKNELQSAMDRLSNYSGSMQSKAKAIINGTFRYCLENDLLEKNYSQFVKINAPEEGEQKHTAYTPDQITYLWEHLETPIPLAYSKKDVRDIYPVDLILIAIYTGMRPGEILAIKNENVHIDERYMIGGFKTPAGLNRIIPIHEKIYPLIKKRLDEGGNWLVKYKSDHSPTMNQFRRYFFNPIMEKLKFDNLPHDGRHTFATFAEKCDIKDLHVKLIMGHKANDITKDVYTHITPAILVESVNKIDFLKK